MQTINKNTQKTIKMNRMLLIILIIMNCFFFIYFIKRAEDESIFIILAIINILLLVVNLYFLIQNKVEIFHFKIRIIIFIIGILLLISNVLTPIYVTLKSYIGSQYAGFSSLKEIVQTPIIQNNDRSLSLYDIAEIAEMQNQNLTDTLFQFIKVWVDDVFVIDAKVLNTLSYFVQQYPIRVNFKLFLEDISHILDKHTFFKHISTFTKKRLQIYDMILLWIYEKLNNYKFQPDNNFYKKSLKEQQETLLQLEKQIVNYIIQNDKSVNADSTFSNEQLEKYIEDKLPFSYRTAFKSYEKNILKGHEEKTHSFKDLIEILHNIAQKVIQIGGSENYDGNQIFKEITSLKERENAQLAQLAQQQQ